MSPRGPHWWTRQTSLLLALMLLAVAPAGGIDLRTGNLVVADRTADPFGFGDARGALVLVDEGAIVPVQLIASPPRFVDPVATLPLGDGTILCVDLNADILGDGQSRGGIWLIDPSQNLPGTAQLFAARREWVTPLDILEEASGDILLLDSDADPLGLGTRPGALYRILRANRQVLQVASSSQWVDPRSMVYDIDGSVLIWDTRADPRGLGTFPGALFRVDPVTGITDLVFSLDEFTDPHAIAVDREGNYLLLDRDANPSGHDGEPGGIYRIRRSDLQITPLIFPPEFVEPFDLVLDPSGDIWVADLDANPFQFPSAKGAIFRCDPNTGEVVRSIASGFFRDVYGLAQFAGTALDSSNVFWEDLSGPPLQPGDRMRVTIRPRNTGSVPGRPVSVEHEIGLWWDFRVGSDSVSHGSFSYDPIARKATWQGDIEVQGEGEIRYEIRIKDSAPEGLALDERIQLSVGVSGSPFTLRTMVARRSDPGRIVWADYQPAAPITRGRVLEKNPNQIFPTVIFSGAPLILPDDLVFLDDGTIAILDRRSLPLGPGTIPGGIYLLDPLTGSLDTLLAVADYPELRFPVGLANGQSGELLITDKDANPSGHPGLPGAVFRYTIDSGELTLVASDPDFREPSDSIVESTGKILMIDYEADPFGTNFRGGALFEIDPIGGSVEPIFFPVERFVDPIGLTEGPGRRVYVADISADPSGIGGNTGAVFMVDRGSGNQLFIAAADSNYVDPTDVYATEGGDLIVSDREANPLGLPMGDHGAVFRVRPIVGDPEVIAADPTLYGPESVVGFTRGRIGSAKIEVEKLGGGPTQGGDTVRFEARIRNTGRAAVSEAMATLALSPELTLLDAEGSEQVLFDVEGGAVSWLGGIGLGDTIRVRADALVAEGLDFGTSVFGLLRVSGPGAAPLDSAIVRVVAVLGPGNLVLVDTNADPENLGAGDGALFLLRTDLGKVQTVLQTETEWIEPTALETFEAGKFLLSDTRLGEPGVVFLVDYLNGTSEPYIEDPRLGSPRDLHRTRSGDLLIVDPFAVLQLPMPIGPAIFIQRAGQEDLELFSIDPALRQPLEITEDENGHLWVVDRTADPNGIFAPGRGALFRLDPATGAVIDTLQFSEFTTPSGIVSSFDQGLLVVDGAAQGSWLGTGAVFRVDPQERSLEPLVTDRRFRSPLSAVFAASGELWIVDRVARDESLPGSPRTLFKWEPTTGEVQAVGASGSYVTPNQILALPGPNPRMEYQVHDFNGPPIEAGDELEFRVRLQNIGPVATSSAAFVDTLPSLISLDMESAQADAGFLEFEGGFNGLVWSVDIPAEGERSLVYRGQVRISTLQGTPLFFRSHLRTVEGVHRELRFTERIPVYFEDEHLYMVDSDADPFDLGGNPGALWKVSLRSGRMTTMASSALLRQPVQTFRIEGAEPELFVVDSQANPNNHLGAHGAILRWLPGTAEFAVVAADSLFLSPRHAVPINDHELLLLDPWADPLNLTDGYGLGPGAVFLVDIESGDVEVFKSDSMFVSPVGLLLDGRGGVLIIDERADPSNFGLRNGAVFRLDLAERTLSIYAVSADFRNPIAGVMAPDGSLLLLDRSVEVEQEPDARGAVYRVDAMGNVRLELSSPNFRYVYDIALDSQGRILVSDRDADPRGTSGRLGAIFRQAGSLFTTLSASFLYQNPSGFFIWDVPTAIELTDLAAVATDEGIRIGWWASENWFNGFLCLRAEGNDPEPTEYRVLNEGDPISGRGPFTYLDRDVVPGADYTYLILGLLPHGGERYYGPIRATAVAIRRFALHPPIPNPSKGETSVRFDLPYASEIELKVYDLSGRCVRTLVDASLPYGRHALVWDGRNGNGHPVASGLYLLRLSMPGEVVVRRLVLLR